MYFDNKINKKYILDKCVCLVLLYETKIYMKK